MKGAKEENGSGGDVDFCACRRWDLKAVGVTGVAVLGAELEVGVL